MGVKRARYEREGVREFWFVDLDADEIHVHRLRGAAYGDPEVVTWGDEFSSVVLPGLVFDVDDLLGPPGGH